jgi:inosose dehydratase
VGVVFGTAPDSWGVWRPEHPSQPPWPRFLDEAQAAGYRWIELGPFGYLPTDAGRLADELGRRELGLLAGTFFGELHHTHARAELRRQAGEIGALVAGLGARFMVLMPGGYRGTDGAVARPTSNPTSGAGSWRRSTSSAGWCRTSTASS